MRKFGLFVLILIALAGPTYLLRVQPGQARSGRRLLYLTMSAGFKHDSIPLSREIVKEIGEKSGALETVFADDVLPFTVENLRIYVAVMFCNTGEVLFTEVQNNIF